MADEPGFPPLPPIRKITGTLFMLSLAVRGSSARDRISVSIAHRQDGDETSFWMARGAFYR
jgi:hypothetical protein